MKAAAVTVTDGRVAVCDHSTVMVAAAVMVTDEKKKFCKSKFLLGWAPGKPL